MSGAHTVFDWARQARTGLPEVVLAESKTILQLRDIIEANIARKAALLLTRLTDEQAGALSDLPLQFNAMARTAALNPPASAESGRRIGIVTAGTSDLPVAEEAGEVARFLGMEAEIFADLGVAGLWRLLERAEELNGFDLLIAVAGMEGALFSVLSGLVRPPVIAVPTSVGYGVAQGGQAALSSALASCAPGLVTVNIDNGFGAAMAAARLLRVNG
ncbi:nickel pincer cofactor biosynthesis protein LarB [Oceaniglobus trochenteri]|uniref:nickel pincer cofactor biosynthesis protein LarB n=1 Tax=Oceaniglobus trochenteri TaxID=2763260 RepID=UPI001CFF9E03|nr:nickel pincer cofactor biosynthesis protein LarB [Oceaniglobus trochenteri]